MRIAYLFFAYKNPILIRRTIDRLTYEGSSFFIHLDRKSDMEQFASIRGPNVRFTDIRLTVHWAEFSGVEAILLLIREALAAREHYDYLVLLSGSEYPLRSADYIQQFFTEHRGVEFMTLSKMPAPGKPLSRITTVRYPSSRPVMRFTFRVLAKCGLAQRDFRKHLGDLEPYSGLTWWALTREACQYIVEWTEREHQITKYFENVFAPEESFFHTVLGNSPFRSRMRRNLLFEDWSPRKGGKCLKAQWHALPAMINERHCAFFEANEKVCVQDLHGPGELLFARKLSDNDLHLVQRIDEMISQKERRRVATRGAHAP